MHKWAENSPEEKGLEVFVDEFIVSWQCVLAVQKASHILGCSKRSVTNTLNVLVLGGMELFSSECLVCYALVLREKQC